MLMPQGSDSQFDMDIEEEFLFDELNRSNIIIHYKLRNWQSHFSTRRKYLNEFTRWVKARKAKNWLYEEVNGDTKPEPRTQSYNPLSNPKTQSTPKNYWGFWGRWAENSEDHDYEYIHGKGFSYPRKTLPHVPKIAAPSGFSGAQLIVF